MARVVERNDRVAPAPGPRMILRPQIRRLRLRVGSGHGLD